MLADPDSAFELAPLDRSVAEAVKEIDRELVPDMPDRVIAATALACGVSLISRDPKIRAALIQTIW